MKRKHLIVCCAVLFASALPAQVKQTQIQQQPTIKLRELLRIQGVRENRLEGIGLITGLRGTGDGTVAARQALVNYLARRGLKVRTDAVASGNIALVRIEAILPPFAHHGTRMDVTVSSLGEATSLRGGTLLTSELRDESGREIFALAGGPILLGGFEAKGTNAKVTKNHPTVGILPGGAICEPTVEDIEVKLLNDKGELCFIVNQRSFETVRRASKVINDLLIKKRIGFSRIQDENLICLNLDRAWRERDALNKLIAEILELEIQPSPIAKVVLDEKTGTIIIGQDVRLSPCIIQVADLTIQVVEDDFVSQPLPGINNGKTKTVRQTKIDVMVKGNKPKKVGGGASLNDLLESLQALGVDGQKLITILHRLHEAGYLHADLVTR